MAPTLVRAPFHRPGWIYEEKVDGYRMLAYKDGARVRLVSRNGVDHTRRYPDVAAAFAQLKPSTLVLDGELAVFDEQLRSRFEWLRDPDESVVATPPVLIAFDVLYAKARDVSQRPLRVRRAHLEDLLAGANVVYPARRLAEDGLKAWAQVVERGYEGLVAKDESSAYESGRTMRWLKVKQEGLDGRGGSLAADDQCGAAARGEGQVSGQLTGFSKYRS
jgi:bifunctional non-homologous end joining protein LigD